MLLLFLFRNNRRCVVTYHLLSRVHKESAKEGVQLSKGAPHTGPAAGGLLRRLALYLFSMTVSSMLQSYGFTSCRRRCPHALHCPVFLSGAQAQLLCLFCSTACTPNGACLHVCDMLV